jgi:DNA-binding transcriptional regulator YdaS (Cro superfamily)
MSPEDLAEKMRNARFNVKRLAFALCVAERTVYQWLDGSRQMPAMAAKLLEYEIEKTKHGV